MKVITRPSCTHKTTAIHIYGVYKRAGIPFNEIELCDSCGADLWARIKDSVAAQHMHYQIISLTQ